MQPDMGQVQFNPRHRQDSQAVQAVFGVRWVLLGLLGYLGQIAWVTMAVLAAGGGFASLDGGVQLALWLLSGVAFACGAWGTWQVVEAMDWGRFVAFGLIIAFLVPYLRLLALLVVALLGFDFIHGRGFRITLWGKPMRRRGAADAGTTG
jgi:hypothetical protein